MRRNMLDVDCTMQMEQSVSRLTHESASFAALETAKSLRLQWRLNDGFEALVVWRQNLGGHLYKR